MARSCLALLLWSLLACGQTFTAPPSTYPTLGKVIRESPGLDALLAPDTPIQVIASNMEWAEGPVWDRRQNCLLFSDIPRNSVMKWTQEHGLEVYLKPSGYTGLGSYSNEPGSNGLLLDREGRLYSCEHGDRRVSRMEPGKGKQTLVDQFEGKRLNSPNDLTLKSNGDLYFTDPIYGLPKQADDPARELDLCGVYRWSASTGKVTLLTQELSRPNGIAFSPDEKTLYVANSDPKRAIWMSYPVQADGTLGPGRVFADVTAMVDKLPGLPDGMKVDRSGNLWATGPGGIHIYAPNGQRLGRIETGEATANVAFGNDGTMLYITADMYVLRMQTKSHGW